MNIKTALAFVWLWGVVCLLLPREADAQGFGAELHATMMPASGGMAGASVALPQDLQSALASNPATLTQFKGTQFSFSGGWTEPTVNIDNDANLPNAGIVPYSDKSGAPGVALGNIGVTQDYSAFGMPVTFGLGLLAGSGLGVDFRDAVGDGAEPNASNGTSALLQGLNIGASAGVELTDRLSLGAQMIVTSATLDGPFAGLGAAVPAYGLRGNLGVAYALGDHTHLGFYWLTRQSFRFDDAVLLQTSPGNFATAQDINLDLPETFGWGIANDRLMCGRLLLAGDILYKRYSKTDLFGSLWDDQFVLQAGAQYRLTRKIRVRMGYAYAENIMRDLPSSSVGGVLPPDALNGLQYVQAQFPAINEHRISGGVGVENFFPGVDFDLFAGGMFDTDDQFGQTAVSVESYWIGMGMTWRFGRGACERLPVPDDWCPHSNVGCGLD
ncbi:MAG: OmpP1/FadL family transporter [Aeoliella sp.]